MKKLLFALALLFAHTLLIGCGEYVDASREVLHRTNESVSAYADAAKVRDSVERVTQREDALQRTLCSPDLVILSRDILVITYTPSSTSHSIYKIQIDEFERIKHECRQKRNHTR